MQNPTITNAAGQLRTVAIMGCHKKGEQSKAVMTLHGSM